MWVLRSLHLGRAKIVYQGKSSTPLVMTLSRVTRRAETTKVDLNAEGFLATFDALLLMNLENRSKSGGIAKAVCGFV